MIPRILVTGAAGFIGSHLTDMLLERDCEVVGFDDFSSGKRANLRSALKNPRFRLIEGSLLDSADIARALKRCKYVFHLAADPEVRVGEEKPDSHFHHNLGATFSLLEEMRKRGAPTRLVFASTSTVYGEAAAIPTPEEYGPLMPISTYGATKLGCEALCSSYTQLLPLHVAIFRLANIVGPRSRHGVIYDFITKLQKNPRELAVLGDGTQSKSYLHVDDCVDAFARTLEDKFWKKPVDVYNIGSDDRTNVLVIAKTVAAAMNLSNATIRPTAKPGERAWPGDVRRMQLDTSKIKALGWKAKRGSDEAVRTATGELLRELSEAGEQTGQ